MNWYSSIGKEIIVQIIIFDKQSFPNFVTMKLIFPENFEKLFFANIGSPKASSVEWQKVCLFYVSIYDQELLIISASYR